MSADPDQDSQNSNNPDFCQSKSGGSNSQNFNDQRNNQYIFEEPPDDNERGGIETLMENYPSIYPY